MIFRNFSSVPHVVRPLFYAVFISRSNVGINVHGSPRRLQPLSSTDITKEPRWMMILSIVSLCTAP